MIDDKRHSLFKRHAFNSCSEQVCYLHSGFFVSDCLEADRQIRREEKGSSQSRWR